MANTSLTTIVDSYGCMSNYQDMKAFFANPTNSRGIQDAVNKYGLPVENRKSYNTGFGLFKKNWGWVEFCDWQNIAKFYQYARISSQFPTLSNPQTDCTKVASAILALSSQLASADSVSNDANIKTALKDALNDKIAEYQSFNVVSDCENLVKNQSYISTTGATSKTAIYIFGGAAVVIGLFYAIAVYKKNN
jgi:hypothetical protein